MDKWDICTLGDLTDNFDAGRIPVRESDRQPGPYPYYGASGIVDYIDGFLFDGEYLLIAEDGENLRTRDTPIAFLATGKFWTNNHAHVVRANGNADTRFLKYALMNLDISGWLTGSTMPKLTQANMNGIMLPAPPLAEQQAIAHILGTLDDKIELNRRMNETLEEMARALFKSWFVDFDPVRAKMDGRWLPGESLPGLHAHLYDLFPDRLVDSELGEIPEGWKVSTIEDVAERVAMGPFGSSILVATFVDAGIPLISGQHLNGTLLEDNQYRFITKGHAERLAKANVQRGDVIFTHAGSIGQVAYIPETSQYERYVISQRQFYMRCDISRISPRFVVHFFKTSGGQHQLLANTSSTGVPSIARPVTYLRSIKFCLPSEATWREYDEIVRTTHLNLSRNIADSHTLAAQRDVLLPSLLSGERRLG